MAIKNKQCGNGNLRVPTSEQAREYGARGGVASAKAQKRRAIITQAVAEACDRDISTIPALKRVAVKYGLKDVDTQLDFVVQAIFTNEAKRGNFKSIKDLLEIMAYGANASNISNGILNELVDSLQRNDDEPVGGGSDEQ